MGDGDFSLGDDVLELAGHEVDGLHPVMHEEDLPVSLQFPEYGFPDEPLVSLGDIGLDGQPLFGGRFHGAHIPHSHQRHVQGTGDGGSAEGKNINLPSLLLEVFLVSDAEALLFVND